MAQILAVKRTITYKLKNGKYLRRKKAYNLSHLDQIGEENQIKVNFSKRFLGP